jgi:hypothetical protein
MKVDFNPPLEQVPRVVILDPVVHQLPVAGARRDRFLFVERAAVGPHRLGAGMIEVRQHDRFELLQPLFELRVLFLELLLQLPPCLAQRNVRFGDLVHVVAGGEGSIRHLALSSFSCCSWYQV